MIDKKGVPQHKPCDNTGCLLTGCPLTKSDCDRQERQRHRETQRKDEGRLTRDKMARQPFHMVEKIGKGRVLHRWRLGNGRALNASHSFKFTPPLSAPVGLSSADSRSCPPPTWFARCTCSRGQSRNQNITKVLSSAAIFQSL